MNQDGIDLLKAFEGCRLKAYIPVPGDVPTIGYGHTEGVSMGDTITKQKAEALLKTDILKYEAGVLNYCSLTPNENQLAAMTCLAFNIGLRNDKKKSGFFYSTVRRQHNLGNEQAACRAFGLFNKSGGVVLAGLTRRRAAESALYLKPEPERQADHPMPQTIDGEAPVATRPLSLLGGLTTLGGALGTVSSVSDQATDAATKVGSITATVHSAKGWIGEAVGAVGFTPLEIGSLALLVIGGGVVYYRWRQRTGGWA